jgi:hypothetical protein
MNLPVPKHEARFHDRRRYRLDLFWEEYGIGAEVHGGVWKSGRHTRGAGFTEDRRKMNLALECGIKVFEFTTEMVESGEAVRQLARVFAAIESEAAA